MIEENYDQYFEILELTPDASLSEIRKAYLCLKEFYSTDSIATLPLKDEIPEKQKKEILLQIEKAYNSLSNLLEKEKNDSWSEKKSRLLDKNLKKTISGIKIFGGQALRRIRKKLNIDLHEIAFATCIRKHYLEYIELEKYEALPPEVYIRSYIVSYAEYLSLDPRKVADDYMNRYREWKDMNRIR